MGSSKIRSAILPETGMVLSGLLQKKSCSDIIVWILRFNMQLFHP
ncbi:MAG: hypothetical protein ACJASO_000638 [Cyclobacteriaceae bacterium]|jgi:hypothetical protein